MECAKCGVAMLAAQFRIGAYSVPPCLARKRGKGAFEPEHQRGVDLFPMPRMRKNRVLCAGRAKSPV